MFELKTLNGEIYNINVTKIVYLHKFTGNSFTILFEDDKIIRCNKDTVDEKSLELIYGLLVDYMQKYIK